MHFSNLVVLCVSKVLVSMAVFSDIGFFYHKKIIVSKVLVSMAGFLVFD